MNCFKKWKRRVTEGYKKRKKVDTEDHRSQAKNPKTQDVEEQEGEQERANKEKAVRLLSAYPASFKEVQRAKHTTC